MRTHSPRKTLSTPVSHIFEAERVRLAPRLKSNCKIRDTGPPRNFALHLALPCSALLFWLESRELRDPFPATPPRKKLNCLHRCQDYTCTVNYTDPEAPWACVLMPIKSYKQNYSRIIRGGALNENRGRKLETSGKGRGFGKRF